MHASGHTLQLAAAVASAAAKPLAQAAREAVESQLKEATKQLIEQVIEAICQGEHGLLVSTIERLAADVAATLKEVRDAAQEMLRAPQQAQPQRSSQTDMMTGSNSVWTTRMKLSNSMMSQSSNQNLTALEAQLVDATLTGAGLALRRTSKPLRRRLSDSHRNLKAVTFGSPSLAADVYEADATAGAWAAAEQEAQALPVLGHVGVQ